MGSTIRATKPASSTPVAAEPRDAMLPYLGQHFGKPSSAHAYGAEADEEVGRERQRPR
jgi:cysteine sulfinate desulfinase/cysteine desulfurase-like protein